MSDIANDVETTENEEVFGVTDQLITDTADAIEEGDGPRVMALLEPLHAADIAQVIEQIDGRARNDLMQLAPGLIDGDVLSELDEGIREDAIGALAPRALADAMRDLESDDVVDLVEYLDDEQQGAVLDALDAGERVLVERALQFPEESAGRHMQSETVHVPEHWSVGEAIDFLRARDDLPEQFYHVILVTPRMNAIGQVTLGRIMSSPRATKLADITEEVFRTFQVDDPAEDVAYAFNHYHLISAPVLDENERLIGMITIDDAMTLLDEELEEDILRLAGVGEGNLSDSIAETTRQRLPWLFVNLLTAILASVVIANFEDVIAGLVALAVLMPIVASMGGNAGTQTLTVAVRGIATRDLTGANLWRVVRKEAGIGLINGIVFAIVLGLVGWVWFDLPELGVVIAVAMVINMLVAGLAGTMIPVALEKVGVDPALASGAFVTTVTDIVGFFVFLGLAGAVLI